MGVSSRDVRAVQAFYPRIYLACHLRHVRRATSPANVTAGESMVLGHLDARRPIRPTSLAAHLGVAKSSLSATIKRLTALGYVARVADEKDGRSAGLCLTRAGARAMAAGSVLDESRVKALLLELTPGERARAVEGLALLARAAGALPKKQWRNR
jgi:DNA-binding MarR family transcriptional regulator